MRWLLPASVLAAFLAGCGNLSHDVSHNRRYLSGGFVPGHIYRTKTEATVVVDPVYPNLLYLREGHYTLARSGLLPVLRLPAGSRVRVDSLYHSHEVWLTETSSIDIYGVVLGHADLPLRVDYGQLFPDGRRPLIPFVDPRYLEDISSHRANEP